MSLLVEEVEKVKVVGKQVITEDLLLILKYHLIFSLTVAIFSMAFYIFLPLIGYVFGFIAQIIYAIMFIDPLKLISLALFLLSFFILLMLAVIILSFIYIALAIVGSVVISQKINVTVPRTKIQQVISPTVAVICAGVYLYTIFVVVIGLNQLGISPSYGTLVPITRDNIGISMQYMFMQFSYIWAPPFFIALVYAIIGYLLADIGFYVYRRVRKLKLVAVKTTKITYITEREYNLKKKLNSLGVTFTFELKILVLITIFLAEFIILFVGL